MKIQLENPYDKVKQEEVTETVSEIDIFTFEDTGSEIRVRTNIGLFTLYSGKEYPSGGIFNLRKDDVITKFKTQLSTDTKTK